jgi:hypothetical protein
MPQHPTTPPNHDEVMDARAAKMLELREKEGMPLYLIGQRFRLTTAGVSAALQRARAKRAERAKAAT